MSQPPRADEGLLTFKTIDQLPVFDLARISFDLTTLNSVYYVAKYFDAYTYFIQEITQVHEIEDLYGINEFVVFLSKSASSELLATHLIVNKVSINSEGWMEILSKLNPLKLIDSVLKTVLNHRIQNRKLSLERDKLEFEREKFAVEREERHLAMRLDVSRHIQEIAGNDQLPEPIKQRLAEIAVKSAEGILNNDAIKLLPERTDLR
jgi:hypothetical protein